MQPCRLLIKVKGHEVLPSAAQLGPRSHGTFPPENQLGEGKFPHADQDPGGLVEMSSGELLGLVKPSG